MTVEPDIVRATQDNQIRDYAQNVCVREWGVKPKL